MKTQYLFIICIFFIQKLDAQSFSAQELLEKSISYHDPKGNWDNFNATLKFEQKTPDKANSFRWAHINNAKNSFEFWSEEAEGKVKHAIKNDVCTHSIAGKTEFSEELAEKYKLTCERTQLWRNYYTYLYGLPMKLKDAGTILHEEVQDTSFMKQACWGIKVTYEEAVGKNIWYFYLDKTTYELIGYRFFYDESKNDGEYITLKEEEIINEVRIPKTRAWYYNKDDKYLGTDLLIKE